MYRYRAESKSYISVWYLLGAFFWFPWIFVLANVLLSTHEVTGVMQSVVSAWYAQNLEGWWFTAVGLAAAYFFIPKVINQPVYSYSLATLGFWTFAFFSGLTGMVRLSGGPVPVWLVTLSIASSIMMLVPVTTVTVNLLATIRNHFDSFFHSPTMRFMVFGTVAFAIASLFGILSSPRSVDSIVHFTPFVQGHQQLVLYSFFTMIMFGAIYYITPRLVGCEWLSSTLISVHFLAVAYGGSLAVATLIFAGLAQGLTLADPGSTFSQIFGIAEVYNPGHTIACFLIAIGHTVFALHFLLMLLRIGQPAGEATLFSTEESH
jgi:cytochrome c oxidase cbb3-type subunit 1